MNRLSSFVSRERLYLLLLAFIILVNALVFVSADRKPRKDAAAASAAAESAGAGVKRAPSVEDMASRRAEVERIFSENRPLAAIFSLTALLAVAVLLLGIVIDLMLIVSALSRRRLDIATYAPQPVAWGGWDVAKVMILFLFFGYIMIMIETVLVRVVPAVRHENFRMILNSSVLDTLGVIFILYFSVGQYREKLISLGLSLRNFGRNVFYGVVGYIAVIPALIAVLGVTAFVINMFKYVPAKQPVVELFLKEKDAMFLFYTSTFAAIVGPVIEELFFRGFMYNAFKKRVGVVGASLVTASLFAALHAHAVGFLPIMILGMLLAYLYEKTGTLVSSITVHVMHNLAMVLLVFLVKQLGIG